MTLRESNGKEPAQDVVVHRAPVDGSFTGGASSATQSLEASEAGVASGAPDARDARRARAWYSGPCLRGSAYSLGLTVQ